MKSRAAQKFSFTNRKTLPRGFTSRSEDLQELARSMHCSFEKDPVRNPDKFKGYDMAGLDVLYQENTLIKTSGISRMEISDLVQSDFEREVRLTVLRVTVTRLAIVFPNFMLRPQGLISESGQPASAIEIKFPNHQVFSRKYALWGAVESDMRQFFSAQVIQFLEDREAMNIECKENILLMYKTRTLMTLPEICQSEKFACELLNILHDQRVIQTV